MHDDILDPKMQQLVAALYGELTGEEEREFQRLLAEDPALRAEWEELQSSRRVLASLETEATSPSFVFLADEPVSERRVAADGGWRDRLRGILFGRGPAWGLAVAAVMVAVLGLSDFRIQRVDGGVAFRFGEPEPVAVTVPPIQQNRAPNLDDLLAQDGAQVTQVSGGTPPYVTHSDLDTYETQILGLMRAMLQDYQSYRDQELSGVVRALYSDMDKRQDDVYDDLRGRIETLNLGFKIEQSEADLRYQKLLQNDARRLDNAPAEGVHPNDQQKEDNQ